MACRNGDFPPRGAWERREEHGGRASERDGGWEEGGAERERELVQYMLAILFQIRSKFAQLALLVAMRIPRVVGAVMFASSLCTGGLSISSRREMCVPSPHQKALDLRTVMSVAAICFVCTSTLRR